MRYLTSGATGLGITIMLAASPAFAVECVADFQRYSARVQAANVALKNTSRGGKLVAETACPRLRNLVAIQGEMLNYMVANKDWCHIPDDAVDNARVGRNKASAIAAKACQVAAMNAKQRKLQAQQQAAGAAGQGGGGPPPPPRLPAGPL